MNAENRTGPRRILIVSFFTHWLTHLGTELELAQRHLDNGDLVDVLGCHGSVGVCEVNKNGNKVICSQCTRLRRRALGLLSDNLTLHNLDDYLTDHHRMTAVEWASRHQSSIDTIENGFANLDLGWAAVSSTVTALRDPDCSTKASRAALLRFNSAAIKSYLATQAFLKKHPVYDVAYIFNGRFAVTRGAWRACQESGLASRLHERGSDLQKYSLHDDCLPHDINNLTHQIQETWRKRKYDADSLLAASAFFEDRRAGVERAWTSFIRSQSPGRLPSSWDPKKLNAVIFTSSDDELAGIGDEFRNTIYRDQLSAIESIANDALQALPKYHFTIRMHPNLLTVTNGTMAGFRKLKNPNVTVISPGSAVSSYALIDNADVAISFGSTMGIEATYWNKTSVVAGPCLFQGQDAVYHPKSHAELMHALHTLPPPKPRENTLPYGYFMQTFGTPFQYWKATGISDGYFKGTKLSLLLHSSETFAQTLRRSLRNGLSRLNLLSSIRFARIALRRSIQSE